MNNDAGPTRKEHPLAAEPGARRQLPAPSTKLHWNSATCVPGKRGLGALGPCG